MYQNVEALYETGFFWKNLGRHERSYRCFREAVDRDCPNLRAWTECMECVAFWFGSASLVRELYPKMESKIPKDSKHYRLWCDQAVELAPDGTSFLSGLRRLEQADPQSTLLQDIDKLCNLALGLSLRQVLAGEASETACEVLVMHYHISRAQHFIQVENNAPKGILAVHSILAAESVQMKDMQVLQGLLLNAQQCLLECQEMIQGVAQSHGSRVPADEMHSLKERERILAILTNDYARNDAIALNRHGSTLILAQKPDDALLMLQRAYSVDPRPKPLINMASILAGKGTRSLALGETANAARFYQQAIEKLNSANTLPELEPGDRKKITDDLEYYRYLTSEAAKGLMQQYPLKMIADMQTRQRELAKKHSLFYGKKRPSVAFIRDQVENRFRLEDADQAYTCARELLEDYCPAFIADVLLQLKERANPLFEQLGKMGQDASAGILCLEARETLCLCVLLAGGNIPECAAQAMRVQSASGINSKMLLAWMESYLETGFCLIVYWYNTHIHQTGSSTGPVPTPPTGKPTPPFALFLLAISWMFVALIIAPYIVDLFRAPVLNVDSDAAALTFEVDKVRLIMSLVIAMGMIMAPMWLVNQRVFARMTALRIFLPGVLRSLVFPLFIIGIASCFSDFDVTISSEHVAGRSDRLFAKHESITLVDIAKDKTQVDWASNLHIRSNDKQKIFLPHLFAHKRDIQVIYKRLVISVAAVQTGVHREVDHLMPSAQPVLSGTPTWCWACGLFPLPILFLVLVLWMQSGKSKKNLSQQMYNRRFMVGLIVIAILSLIIELSTGIMMLRTPIHGGIWFWVLFGVVAILTTLFLMMSLAIHAQAAAKRYRL